MDWHTISFDCYGTLVDWETGIGQAFARQAAAEGRELDGSQVMKAYLEIEPAVQAGEYRPYREVLRQTAVGVAERLGWELEPRRARFLAESLPDWPVFPDTPAALRRLSRRFKLGILSNIDADLLAATLSRIGVDFDWTVTAEDVRSYKPAAAHFEEAVRRVGDRRGLLHAAQSRFHDIRPAMDLGIASVWVNRRREPVLEQVPPLWTVPDLRGLAEWLET